MMKISYFNKEYEPMHCSRTELKKYFLKTYFHVVTLWKLKSELIVEKQILAVFIVLKNDAKL